MDEHHEKAIEQEWPADIDKTSAKGRKELVKRMKQVAQERRAQRQAQLREERINEAVMFGSLTYDAVHSKDSRMFIEPPGGADNRPAEKLVRGKDKGHEEKTWKRNLDVGRKICRPKGGDMETLSEVQRENNKVLMEARDYLAMELDPDAFRPITGTHFIAADWAIRRSRQGEAVRKASLILQRVIKAVDSEYADYYSGKAAQA